MPNTRITKPVGSTARQNTTNRAIGLTTRCNASPIFVHILFSGESKRGMANAATRNNTASANAHPRIGAPANRREGCLLGGDRGEPGVVSMGLENLAVNEAAVAIAQATEGVARRAVVGLLPRADRWHTYGQRDGTPGGGEKSPTRHHPMAEHARHGFSFFGGESQWSTQSASDSRHMPP